MALETKTLDLRVEQRLYWLIVDDGRRFSASSAEGLVSIARGHLGENPLALGPSDRVTLAGTLADFAPVLEGLQPNVEMTQRLECALSERSDAEDALPVFPLGNLVNDAPWGWFFVPRSSESSIAKSAWRLVPQRLADRSARTVLLASSSNRRKLHSALFLDDSVGLEFGTTEGFQTEWADVRYDVEDATEFARTHLNRTHIGLPTTGTKAACPYCEENPLAEWAFKIKVEEPVSPDFLGEAMARILEPCPEHRVVPRDAISFQGEAFHWKAGLGGGLEPHQPAVWQRARNRPS